MLAACLLGARNVGLLILSWQKVRLCVSVYVDVNACMHMCVSTFGSRIIRCVFVCMYVYMYAYAYVYVCISDV